MHTPYCSDLKHGRRRLERLLATEDEQTSSDDPDFEMDSPEQQSDSDSTSEDTQMLSEVSEDEVLSDTGVDLTPLALPVCIALFHTFVAFTAYYVARWRLEIQEGETQTAPESSEFSCQRARQ